MHFEMIPESECRERVKNVRSEMMRRGLDVLVIYAPSMKTEKAANTRYLSNWSNAHGDTILILPVEKEPTFLVSPSVAVYVKEQSWISDIRACRGLVSDVKGVLQSLKLANDRVGTVGIDEDMMRVKYEALLKELVYFNIENATDILEDLRLIKSSNEIIQIRKTADICEVAYEAFFDSIRPGIPEYKITAAMEYAAKAEGAETVHFAIASGTVIDRSGIPPHSNILQRGDMISIAFSLSYEGYHNQVSRCCVIGTPNRDQQSVFNAVYESEIAMIDTMKPGVSLSKVAEAGMGPILKAGYEEYLLTRLGHGQGANYGEKPVIPSKSLWGTMGMENLQFKMKDGMVITLHPALVAGKLGGADHGDVCLLTGKDTEVISDFRRGSLIQV